MFSSVQPRVGRRDDRADGLLVEALVALAALEVLEVAAEGAVADEPWAASAPAAGSDDVWSTPGANYNDETPF